MFLEIDICLIFFNKVKVFEGKYDIYMTGININKTQ